MSGRGNVQSEMCDTFLIRANSKAGCASHTTWNIAAVAYIGNLAFL